MRTSCPVGPFVVIKTQISWDAVATCRARPDLVEGELTSELAELALLNTAPDTVRVTNVTLAIYAPKSAIPSQVPVFAPPSKPVYCRSGFGSNRHFAS